MAKPLVSGVLWERIAPLLPAQPPKPAGEIPLRKNADEPVADGWTSVCHHHDTRD